METIIQYVTGMFPIRKYVLEYVLTLRVRNGAHQS